MPMRAGFHPGNPLHYSHFPARTAGSDTGGLARRGTDSLMNRNRTGKGEIRFAMGFEPAHDMAEEKKDPRMRVLCVAGRAGHAPRWGSNPQGKNAEKKRPANASLIRGGEGGIRTRGRVLKPGNHLAGGPIRPLWHLPIFDWQTSCPGGLSGGRGIRTHGGLPHTCFQDRRLKPLGHPSQRWEFYHSLPPPASLAAPHRPEIRPWPAWSGRHGFPR